MITLCNCNGYLIFMEPRWRSDSTENTAHKNVGSRTPVGRSLNGKTNVEIGVWQWRYNLFVIILYYYYVILCITVVCRVYTSPRSVQLNRGTQHTVYRAFVERSIWRCTTVSSTRIGAESLSRYLLSRFNLITKKRN